MSCFAMQTHRTGRKSRERDLGRELRIVKIGFIYCEYSEYLFENSWGVSPTTALKLDFQDIKVFENRCDAIVTNF